MWDHLLGPEYPFRAKITEENCLSHSENHQLAIVPQIELRFHETIACLWRDYDWLDFCKPSYAVSDTMSSGVILHCHVHHILFWYSAFFFLTVTIFAFLSVKFPEPWAEELWYRCCIYRWAQSSFLLYACLLAVGLCTTTFYIKKSIWWGFRYTLIYGHEDKNLVDSL